MFLHTLLYLEMRKMGAVCSISNFLEGKRMNVCSTVKNDMHVMTVRVKLMDTESFIAESKEKEEKLAAKIRTIHFHQKCVIGNTQGNFYFIFFLLFQYFNIQFTF